MKTINTLRSLAVAALAASAVSLPVLAQAADLKPGYASYNTYGYSDFSADCRAKENDARLIGGLLGAVIGGVAGSQVSGNGARTEGSAVGAVLGGLAGAGIGDESVDCDAARYNAYGPDRGVVYNSAHVTNTNYHNGTRGNSGYNNGYYGNHYGNQYDRDYYRNQEKLNGVQNAINDVSWRLRRLRQEDQQLARQLRHRWDRRLASQRDRVCDEIERLEKKLRRLESEKADIIRDMRRYR